MFQLGQDGFTYVDTCDKDDTGSGVINSSRNMWQQMDNKGTTESTTQLKSRHKNSILRCAHAAPASRHAAQMVKSFTGMQINSHPKWPILKFNQTKKIALLINLLPSFSIASVFLEQLNFFGELNFLAKHFSSFSDT